MIYLITEACPSSSNLSDQLMKSFHYELQISFYETADVIVAVADVIIVVADVIIVVFADVFVVVANVIVVSSQWKLCMLRILSNKMSVHVR